VSGIATLRNLRELKIFGSLPPEYRQQVLDMQQLELLLQEAVQGSRLTIFINSGRGEEVEPYKVSCIWVSQLGRGQDNRGTRHMARCEGQG
jgi:hypothetical protein